MPHGLKTSSTTTCRSERRPRWPSCKGKKPHDQASADQVQEAVTLRSVAAFPFWSIFVDEFRASLRLFWRPHACALRPCQSRADLIRQQFGANVGIGSCVPPQPNMHVLSVTCAAPLGALSAFAQLHQRHINTATEKSHQHAVTGIGRLEAGLTHPNGPLLTLKSAQADRCLRAQACKCQTHPAAMPRWEVLEIVRRAMAVHAVFPAFGSGYLHPHSASSGRGSRMG